MPVAYSLKVSAQELDLDPSGTDANNATGECSYRSTSTAKRSQSTKPEKDSIQKKKQAEMEKERYDAEVCGSGGSVLSVTSPRVHQHDSTPVLSPSPSMSTLPSPTPPTPESTSCLNLPQDAPSDATYEEELLSYNDDLSCLAQNVHSKPPPQTSKMYPTAVEIAPELFSFAYPSLNLPPSEIDWSADMSSSELTPHPQCYVPHPELNHTIERWFLLNPYLPVYSFP